MATKYVMALYLGDNVRAKGISEALSSDTLETKIVSSSEELYTLLNYERVDLIVLRDELRGFLTGFDIIERMLQDLLRPITVMLCKPTAGNADRAKALGIDLVLPEDSALERICTAIQGKLSAGPCIQVPIYPEARKLVQRCGEIPPLPQILVKLSEHLHNDDLSLDELAEDISLDPRMTAELLKLINSSAMGMNRKITKVFDAVNYLGVKRTISLVMSSAILNAHVQFSRNIAPSDRLWLNRRSILTASTAYIFADRFENISPDTAHVLGLLQDIGILVMSNVLGRPYQQVLRRVRQIGHLQLEAIEREQFGYTHAEVSAALVQRWSLPPSLVTTILNHHETTKQATQSRLEESFTRVMQIGEALANLSDGHLPQRYPALRALLTNYKSERDEECKQAISEAVAKTVKCSQLFAIPVPKDSAFDDIAQKLSELALSPEPLARDGQIPDTVSEAVQHDLHAFESSDEKAEASTYEELPMADEGLEADSLSPQPQTILVVEDDLAIVELARLTLAELGFKVDSCEDLREYQFRDSEIGAVLCDVHLKSDDGIRVTEQLRKRGYVGPIILTSGDRSRSTVGKGILAGANDFLAKPFTPATLLSKVQKWTMTVKSNRTTIASTVNPGSP